MRARSAFLPLWQGSRRAQKQACLRNLMQGQCQVMPAKAGRNRVGEGAIALQTLLHVFFE